jgi:lipopolysaccharide assembly protein A
MDWKFVLVLIFSLLVAVFTMQNADAVNVQFLTFEFTQVSQALVILISAVAGALIALLFGTIRWVKDKSKLMGAKKAIASLETQVRQLRIMLDAEIAKNAPPSVLEMEMPSNLETTSNGEAKEMGLEQETEKQEEATPKRKWYQI